MDQSLWNVRHLSFDALPPVANFRAPLPLFTRVEVSWRRRPGKSQRLAEKVAETRAKGEQSAMMMTLVSSARRHDLDVGVYVKDMLEQLLAGSTDYDRRSGVRGNGWGRQQNHEYCER